MNEYFNKNCQYFLYQIIEPFSKNKIYSLTFNLINKNESNFLKIFLFCPNNYILTGVSFLKNINDLENKIYFLNHNKFYELNVFCDKLNVLLNNFNFELTEGTKIEVVKGVSDFKGKLIRQIFDENYLFID